MADQLFVNNATTTTRGHTSVAATTIVVNDSTGFPSPTAGDWFIATLDGGGNYVEIVRVTAVVGNVWTVIRAQEGTEAKLWQPNSRIECRVTAGSLVQVNQNSLRADLANTTDPLKGDALVGVKQPFTGAVAQTQHDVNAQFVTIKNFGATGLGLVDENAAAQAMITAVGFVRFPIGAYLFNTTTIDAPIYFDQGAYLTVPLGQTLTITGAIDAPRQFIFQGAGSYLLRNDGDSGENSHQVHAAWFGILPDNNAEVDQYANMAKMFASFDNTREAIVNFDIGRYSLSTVGGVLGIPRATWIKGSGTRRTVFNILDDVNTVFSAQANGVKWTDIQFENSDNIVSGNRTSGPYILADQQLCEIYNVWVGNADESIVVTGGQCRLANISATYLQAPGAGSSLVSVRASDTMVDGVLVAAGTFGPSAVVEIGGPDNTANFSNVAINDVMWSNQSIGVHVNANRIISGINIDGLHYRGVAGSNASHIAKLETSGTAPLSDVVINNITSNAEITNGIALLQNSSGSLRRVSIDNVKIPGTSGIGIEFNRTLGTLDEITVGPNTNVKTFATPFSFSGTIGANVTIAALATPSCNEARSFGFSIADDGVASVDLHRTSTIFTGMVLITVGNVEYGLFVARPANTPAVTPISVSANVNSSTSVLTGTTGVDGKFTFGVTNGVLYFENRLGATSNVSATLLFGVK